MKYVLFLLVRELGAVGAGIVASGGDQYFHQKNSIFSGADIFLGFFPLFESILVDVLLSLPICA